MNTSNPELQRLLATLKGTSTNTLYNSTENNTYAHLTNGSLPQPAQTLQIPGPTNTSYETSIQQKTTPTGDPRLKHPSQQAQRNDAARSRTTTPVPSIPDASSIATWPAAVKHVTKHIATSPTTTAAIKRLISTQHTHEETWHKQREEILARHAGRAGNNTKVSNLLAELGGLALPIAKVDEAAEKNELETFDKKVYKNLVAMSRDADKELRRLGVPFFAIKHELVEVNDKSTGNISAAGKLDKGELRELQRRIIQYLEDLFVD